MKTRGCWQIGPDLLSADDGAAAMGGWVVQTLQRRSIFRLARMAVCRDEES